MSDPVSSERPTLQGGSRRTGKEVSEVLVVVGVAIIILGGLVLAGHYTSCVGLGGFVGKNIAIGVITGGGALAIVSLVAFFILGKREQSQSGSRIHQPFETPTLE